MRSSKGLSLVEILVSTTIMSFVALSFMAILLVNYKTNAKVTAIQDDVDAVRAIKERIGTDVREGRSLGDVFGNKITIPQPGDPNFSITVGSDRFPESTTNPIYGGALPYTPINWPTPFRLSNTCLIVQIPVLDNHADVAGTLSHALNPANTGWPTMIPAGWNGGAGPPPATNQDNVETHVYMVVPDPGNPGEWMMQLATYGGRAVPGYVPACHTKGPQTILKGIIGPMDNGGTPKVFQFINRTANGVPDDTILPNATYCANYTGVVVNLEVKRHQFQSAQRKGISQTPIGMKLEVFLRNNALATSTGMPSQ